MKIGFFGDIVGKQGRNAVIGLVAGLRERFNWDFVIANCENAAAGFGVTAKIAEKLFSAGIDVLTSGNHIWDQKEIDAYLNQSKNLIRPANYPDHPRFPTPGKGSVIVPTQDGKYKVAVINLMGRIFMEPVDCPFTVGEKVIEECLEQTPFIIVDFHAETTSEKRAAGWYFSGKVSALVGTHTHIQTADNTVLSGETGYITDAGMCGADRSVIGMDTNKILFRMLTKRKVRFTVASEDVSVKGVSIELNNETGKCKSIERFCESWNP